MGLPKNSINTPLDNSEQLKYLQKLLDDIFETEQLQEKTDAKNKK